MPLPPQDAAEVAGVDAEGGGGMGERPAVAVEPCHIGLKFLRLTGHCGMGFFSLLAVLLRAMFDKQIIYTPKRMARKKSVNEIFISRTKERMKAKSLKQSDLAYMSNIAQGTISEYLNPEKGRTPGAAELARLAQALGVSMGWLWGLEGNTKIDSELYIQKIHSLEGRLLFAKKTLKGALDYLEEDARE